MRSVKVKAIKVNALNYTFLKGLLLHSKTSPFAHQNESFCKPKGVLLQNRCFALANHRILHFSLFTFHLQNRCFALGFNFRCRLCRAMHN